MTGRQTRQVIEFDPRWVACDYCNTDYTESPATGGTFTGGNAICPRCEERHRASLDEDRRNHPELVIDPEAGETFADFVRRRRKPGENRIVITSFGESKGPEPGAADMHMGHAETADGVPAAVWAGVRGEDGAAETIACVAEERNGRRGDASRAAAAFAEGASTGAGRGPERLRAGLEAADRALAGSASDVSLTAVAVHRSGIDYVAAGNGAVGIWDSDGSMLLYWTAEEPGEHRRGLRGTGIEPTGIEEGRCVGGLEARDRVILGTGLVAELDRETLEWGRHMDLPAARAAEWLADQVRERTRDRRPGARVLVLGPRTDVKERAG